MVENELVIPDDRGTGERMMRWFAHEHLPRELQPIAEAYQALAHDIVLNVPVGPERTAALRKLVESKDCAVRAVIEGSYKKWKEEG